MYFYNKDKNKIFYDIINPDSNKDVLVFLNGVMASTNSWANQYDVLRRQGYKIVLHDFLGQLKSDKFEGLYSFEKHAEDLDQLLMELNISKAHLIGTSYGGEVAMKFAVMYQSKVTSLTIIDSVSELDDKLIRSVEEWIDLAETYDGEEFFYGMMPSIYGYSYIKNNKDFLSKRAKAMKQIPKDYFDGQIGLYKTFIKDVTMTKELHNIQCPSLVVCGKEDTLKPVKFSEIIADRIPNSKLVVIPDCGHVTIFEKPEELNGYIIDFLHSI
jgi:3-oxoadipate enol-lactonase